MVLSGHKGQAQRKRGMTAFAASECRIRVGPTQPPADQITRSWTLLATASPCPGESSAGGLSGGTAAPGETSCRDRTATEPLSTDAVVCPPGAMATLKCVPRTLVTAMGVRISMRRSGSALGGTVASTVLGIFMVPVFFLLIRSWFRSRSRSDDSPSTPAQPVQEGAQ